MAAFGDVAYTIGAILVVIVLPLWVLDRLVATMRARREKTLAAWRDGVAPTTYGDVGPAGMAQVRAPRSGWGVLWKWLLVAWTLYFAYDVVSLLGVGGELRRKFDGVLASAYIDNRLSNALLQDFVLWIAGALVLGGLTYATRGQVRWVQVGGRNA